MDTSILRNTKKVLGISLDDSSFDTDIILQVNSAFSTLNQLGIGPVRGFSIEDEEALWEDFIELDDPTMMDMVKTSVFLRVKLAFDPPMTSFHLAALERQIQEHDWRLTNMREEAIGG